MCRATLERGGGGEGGGSHVMHPEVAFVQRREVDEW